MKKRDEVEEEFRDHAILYVIIGLLLILIALGYQYWKQKEMEKITILYDAGFFEIVEVGGEQYIINKDIDGGIKKLNVTTEK
jgi:predicted negative regulator of RcsB-dependent stress response